MRHGHLKGHENGHENESQEIPVLSTAFSQVYDDSGRTTVEAPVFLHNKQTN